MVILKTNEKTYYLVGVSDRQMQDAMWQYIRRKRAEGKALADIIYTWTRVSTSNKPPV